MAIKKVQIIPPGYTDIIHPETDSTMVKMNSGNDLQTDFDAHLADKAPHPNIPVARVYHSLDQTIPNATDTVLAFDSVEYDNDNMYDAGNNTRLTCKTAGKYRITACVMWVPNTTGIRQLEIRKNGTLYIGSTKITPVQQANRETVQVTTCTYNLSAGDYVEVLVKQESGGALDVKKICDYSPVLTMERVG